MEPTRVGVLFGGRSAEHEVSLRSAATVIAALDRERYRIVPIKIRKDGAWEIPSARVHVFLEGLAPAEAKPVFLPPDPTRAELVFASGPTASAETLDVIFPVLHGPFGEDGTIQGLLDLVGIPYVGAGTAASAAGMDKELMKTLFRARGLPVVADQVVRRFDWERDRDAVVRRIEEGFSLPVFVKPANLGSSVGVSKVKHPGELAPALAEALAYDRKALVERAVEAREIELSVLGNDEPRVSLPGEIVPSREFYDYTAKYLDDRSELLIPAPIEPLLVARAQELALGAFRAIDACGMARVDLLLDRASGELFVNEINTIPGFTSISMYPKLWERSGIGLPELVSRLIDLAFERARERRRLRTSYGEQGR